MVRYSYSFSFTPREGLVGTYMFYVTCNRWEDERCVSSETILSRQVTQVIETDQRSKLPAFAVGMVDLAYQELAANLGRLTAEYHSETNARPGDTTVPS